MVNLFGGSYYGSARDHGAKARADSAVRRADSALSKAGDIQTSMEERYDKAMMIIEAMWNIMRDKFDMTNEELVLAVQKVDLEDGVIDGKKTRVVVACPTCERPIGRKRSQCIYCGHELADDLFR